MQEFLGKLENVIVNPLITLLALAAFVYFIWGVVVFLTHAGDEAEHEEGRRKMIWGIIGLVIIFGAKAIIAIGANTLGVPVPQ